MTLSLAWIRRRTDSQELVFASDSRLSGGSRWDMCPKIFPFERGDCAVSFCGYTGVAYPLILQLLTCVSSHNQLRSRSICFTDLKGHFIRILNHLISGVHHLPDNTEFDPDVTFLLGGYCWRDQRFRLYKISYNKTEKRFYHSPASSWRGMSKNKVCMVIDDHVKDFKNELVSRLRSAGKLNTAEPFDFEPLEVLGSFLYQEKFDAIGGAPQILKIYRHMNVVQFGVRWIDGKTYDRGRQLLDYEELHRPVMFFDKDGSLTHNPEHE